MFLPFFELIKVNYHPLVVISSTVVFTEIFTPAMSIVGQSKCN